MIITSRHLLSDSLPTGSTGDAWVETLRLEAARQARGADGDGEHLQETEAGGLVHSLPAWQEHGPHDLQGVHGETPQENVSENDQWWKVIGKCIIFSCKQNCILCNAFLNVYNNIWKSKNI